MKTNPTRALRPILGALLLAVMAGCSALPTAPAGIDVGPGPRSVTTLGRSVTPDPAPVKSATTTKEISVLLGGTVRAGRFTVIIPPAALRQKATVTVTQPDLSRMEVELHITPETANGFRLPVLLLADCNGVIAPKLISLSSIQYYNPQTAKWERVPGSTVNITGLSVQAPLFHFSKYRVANEGKAGW